MTLSHLTGCKYLLPSTLHAVLLIIVSFIMKEKIVKNLKSLTMQKMVQKYKKEPSMTRVS